MLEREKRAFAQNMSFHATDMSEITWFDMQGKEVPVLPDYNVYRPLFFHDNGVVFHADMAIDSSTFTVEGKEIMCATGSSAVFSGAISSGPGDSAKLLGLMQLSKVGEFFYMGYHWE